MNPSDIVVIATYCHACCQASSSSTASELAAAAEDPEIQFLMSLTAKQKKRLLK